jgi:hypothetical protein
MKLGLSLSASLISLAGMLSLLSSFLCGGAYATPISGSSPIQIGGVMIAGGTGDLLTATAFGLTSTTWHAGAHATQSFTLIPINTPIANSLLMVRNLGSYSFTSSDGTFTAVPRLVIGSSTFTSKIVASSGSIAAGTESLAIYLAGNFVPAGGLAAFTADNATETISFTETGITASSFGSFSVSATFASPVAPGLPTAPAPTSEPASLAIFGAGLAGLGVITRRRRA